MLVKQSIVEKWYLTDSWVYKNFAYLFQNPLWMRRIPTGFSICPYFWMSMFSILAFRPFIVFPIQYFILPVMRMIGKPARVVDEFVYKFLQHIFGNNSNTYAPGLGFLGGLAFGFLATIVVGFLLVTGVKGWEFYNYLTTTYNGTFVFWSMFSFAALFGIIASHKAITKTECKSMYYLFVWLALFIIASIVFVPSEVWNIITGTGSLIAEFAIGTKDIAWIVISFVATWVWFGVKIAATWTPINAFHLPWWGYFAIMAITGWIVSKCTTYKNEQNIYTLRQTDPAELYARFRMVWIDSMMQVLLLGKSWKNGSFIAENFDGYMYGAVTAYRQTLLRQTFEKMYCKELDELQKNYPFLTKGAWEIIVKETDFADTRFKMYKNGLAEGSEHFPNFNSENFIKMFESIANSDISVKALAKEYHRKDEEAYLKRQARKNSWTHVTCLKFTSSIASTVHNVGRGLKTIGSNTITFTAYMWMLIKAKKQGACPYFKFTAPTAPAKPEIK